MNYLPKALISKEFDARIWANVVSEVLGGKVSDIFYVSCPVSVFAGAEELNLRIFIHIGRWKR